MKNDTTKKATTKANKEEKTMKKETAKKETKKSVKKEVAQATETAKVETAKEVKANTDKVNTVITIQEVTDMYAKAGIKCANPTAKGNYRIMGSKSSLNIVPKKGEYRIYSTDTDYDAVVAAKLSCSDLTVEKGTNSQDKARPNTIICKTVETLKALLGVYATNPLNALTKTA
jgi:hypothetical protein